MPVYTVVAASMKERMTQNEAERLVDAPSLISPVMMSVCLVLFACIVVRQLPPGFCQSCAVGHALDWSQINSAGF